MNRAFAGLVPHQRHLDLLLPPLWQDIIRQSSIQDRSAVSIVRSAVYQFVLLSTL